MSEPTTPPHNPIVVAPDLVWGTPCFEGTRIGVYILMEYLAAGKTIDDFLNTYTHVRRSDVVAAIELASDLLGHNARPLEPEASDEAA